MSYNIDALLKEHKIRIGTMIKFQMKNNIAEYYWLCVSSSKDSSNDSDRFYGISTFPVIPTGYLGQIDLQKVIFNKLALPFTFYLSRVGLQPLEDIDGVIDHDVEIVEQYGVSDLELIYGIIKKFRYKASFLDEIRYPINPAKFNVGMVYQLYDQPFSPCGQKTVLFGVIKVRPTMQGLSLEGVLWDDEKKYVDRVIIPAEPFVLSQRKQAYDVIGYMNEDLYYEFFTLVNAEIFDRAYMEDFPDRIKHVPEPTLEEWKDYRDTFHDILNPSKKLIIPNAGPVAVPNVKLK